MSATPREEYTPAAKAGPADAPKRLPSPKPRPPASPKGTPRTRAAPDPTDSGARPSLPSRGSQDFSVTELANHNVAAAPSKANASSLPLPLATSPRGSPRPMKTSRSNSALGTVVVELSGPVVGRALDFDNPPTTTLPIIDASGNNMSTRKESRTNVLPVRKGSRLNVIEAGNPNLPVRKVSQTNVLESGGAQRKASTSELLARKDSKADMARLESQEGTAVPRELTPPGPMRRRISTDDFSVPSATASKGKAKEAEVKVTNKASKEFKNEDGQMSKYINEYKMGHTLGKGSFAKVKLAEKDGVKYAVKIIKRTLAKKKGLGRANNDIYERVQKEVAVMKKLHHPNIIQLVEVIDDGTMNRTYMVMEYCSNGVLQELHGDKVVAPIPEEQRRLVCRDVISALAYLHCRGILHRDLKPENMLLDSRKRVKLADFGVSHMFKTPNDLTDVVVSSYGTPTFSSPEGIDMTQEGVSGQLEDVWALGVCLFAMTFGKVPFWSDGFMDLHKKIINDPVVFPPDQSIDPDLKSLIEGFLTKNPAKRTTLIQAASNPWVTKHGLEPLEIETDEKKVVVSAEEVKRAFSGVDRLSMLIKVKVSMGHKVKNARNRIMMKTRDVSHAGRVETSTGDKDLSTSNPGSPGTGTTAKGKGAAGDLPQSFDVVKLGSLGAVYGASVGALHRILPSPFSSDGVAVERDDTGCHTQRSMMERVPRDSSVSSGLDHLGFAKAQNAMREASEGTLSEDMGRRSELCNIDDSDDDCFAMVVEDSDSDPDLNGMVQRSVTSHIDPKKSTLPGGGSVSQGEAGEGRSPPASTRPAV